MSSDLVITVRHRQLSYELRRLREATGRSTVDVAESMGWDRTKVNRIERGKWKRLNPQDVRALAIHYGVEDVRQQDALVEMAKQSKLKGWWERYGDLLGSSAYVALESEASSLSSYEGLVVPGLFQTPEYAAALLRSKRSPEVVQRRTDLRLARQRRLSGHEPLRVGTVVDEAALRKLVGGAAVMRAQLHHLIAASEKANVDLRVVPNSVGAHPGQPGQFVILDFPFAPNASVVFLENAHDGFYLEDPTDVAKYRQIYNEVYELSFGVKDSVDFVHAVLRDLED